MLDWLNKKISSKHVQISAKISEGYMDYGKSFAKILLSAQKPTGISIKGQSLIISQGTKHSVNNQFGGLRDCNLLGRELEFTLSGNGIEMPLVFQLYENTSNHMRLFLYNNKGMLFSVNLTTGYKQGRIDLEQLLKYSSRVLSPSERTKACYDSLAILCMEGIKIIGEKKVHIGTYDVINEKFVDTTPEKFLLDMIKVGLIKGHYSQNKGFSLKLAGKNENKSHVFTSDNVNGIDKLLVDNNANKEILGAIKYTPKTSAAFGKEKSNQENIPPGIRWLKKILKLLISIFLAIVFISGLLVTYGRVTNPPPKVPVVKKSTEISTKTKETPLEIYKSDCEKEYKNLSQWFDKAESDIESAWAGEKRPKYPWDEIRNHQLTARYLSQEEFKVAKFISSPNNYGPSSYYHFAYVDYEYAMLNLTGKNFTGKEYNAAKENVSMGRKELEKFRQAYESFPKIIDAN